MERRKFLTAIAVAPLISFKEPVKKPLDKRIYYATIPVTCLGSWDGITRYSIVGNSKTILKGKF